MTMTGSTAMALELAALREENARLRNGALHAERIEELTRELAEAREHERQTHERLGAILGTDDSLEECAERMRRERDEALTKLASLKDTVRVQQETYLAEHEYWGACKWKAEVARLEAKLAGMLEQFALADQAATDYRKSRDAAEAKLARCVGALNDIAVVQGETLTGDMARAALAAAKGDQPCADSHICCRCDEVHTERRCCVHAAKGE